MIILSSVGIEALHQRSSSCNDNSSLHQYLTLLPAQSQEDEAGEETPHTQAALGMKEPERDHQQEGQPDATEGKVIADYDLDVDYEGSEL